MSDDPKQSGQGTEGEAGAKPTEQASSPREAFVQGMGLLWQAARGAVGGLRKEIQKADIVGGLRETAQEMKRAAESAIHGTPREPEPQDVHASPEQAEEPKGARIATDDEPKGPAGAA